MKLKEIVEAIQGEVIWGTQYLEREVDNAFACDLISDILMCIKEQTLLLTGLTNPQIIRLSDMIDLFGIVFVRGKKPSNSLIEMAKERELPIITTNFTMYQTSGILFTKGLRSSEI